MLGKDFCCACVCVCGEPQCRRANALGSLPTDKQYCSDFSSIKSTLSIISELASLRKMELLVRDC